MLHTVSHTGVLLAVWYKSVYSLNGTRLSTRACDQPCDSSQYTL
ncbi:hypothetical protein F383_18067 [Gossypium arboreum]|uniref:Uncharacterized protein n=1 Tax=Gossypium arboreum TaxID=29729 RepID=A0A0B0NLV1_GOSAR|nr:hypothetical protein F383_18067 [Gossypium arboreum]